MSKNVIINLKIDTKDGVKSIGAVNEEVKTTLSTMREMEEAASLINEKLKDVEVGSEAYQKLSKELIKVNTNLKNQELALEALDHEKVASEIKSVAGGLTDMATGLAMVGVSGESMEKIMQTMAKFEGMSKIVTGGIEAFQSFKKLSGTFDQVRTKFMALDKAMKFSVIGIIALAIGAVVYALSSFSGASEDATEAANKFNTKLEEQKKALSDLVVEYTLLTNAQSEFLTSQNNSMKSVVDSKKAMEELRKISILALDEQYLRNLSLEDFTTILNKAQNAQNAYSEALINEKVQLLDVNQQSLLRTIDLSGQISIQKKLTEELKNEYLAVQQLYYANGESTELLDELNKASTDYNTSLNKQKSLTNEYDLALQTLNLSEKELLDVNEKLTDSDKKFTSNIESGLQTLEMVAKQRGVITQSVINQKQSEEELRREHEKQIQIQRQLIDILDEMNFLRREISIREVEEGIDLAEMKNLDLLAREKAFVDSKKQIQRDEILSTKQKNEYILLLEQQYLLDVQDINNKFREEEKKNVLAHRQFIYDQYITAEETEAINAEKMLADLQFEKELELLKAEQIPNEEERQAKILEIKKSYIQKETDALLLSLAKQVDARTAVYETDLINAGENLVEKEKIEAEYNADIADMYHNTELSIQKLQNDSVDELEKTLAQKVEAVGKWITAIGTLIQQATTLLQTYWTQQAETEKRTRDYAFTEAKEQLAAQLANEEISRKEHDNMLRELDQQKREEEKKAALKAFRQNKALNIVNATMSAAQATIAAFAAGASLGPAGVVMGPVMAGIAAALGVAQIAVVASQKFTAKRGGVVPGAPSKHDSVDAKLAPGETVINSESSMMFPQLLSAINKAGGGISLAPELPINTASSNAVFAQNAPQSVKAYVVESEMTDSQRKINRIQRGAKFSRAN